MSLRLLIDEDSQDKLLVARLQEAGHDVLTVGVLGLLGKPDSAVLASAIAANRILFTGNCDDFAILSAQIVSQGEHHAGILLVRRYNNPKKDMSYQEIVQAIANLEAQMSESGMVLADQTVGLVKFRY